MFATCVCCGSMTEKSLATLLRHIVRNQAGHHVIVTAPLCPSCSASYIPPGRRNPAMSTDYFEREFAIYKD